MLSLSDKQILSCYLLNNWGFKGTEQEELEFEIAINKAIEAENNGRPVHWAKTPSLEAEEIFKRYLEEWKRGGLNNGANAF